MNILLTEDKKNQIDTAKQLEEAIDIFGEKIDGNVTPPAQHHIFYVNENAKNLDGHKKDIFHSATTKLVFKIKRGRPNLETLVFVTYEFFQKVMHTKLSVLEWHMITFSRLFENKIPALKLN